MTGQPTAWAVSLEKAGLRGLGVEANDRSCEFLVWLRNGQTALKRWTQGGSDMGAEGGEEGGRERGGCRCGGEGRLVGGGLNEAAAQGKRQVSRPVGAAFSSRPPLAADAAARPPDQNY